VTTTTVSTGFGRAAVGLWFGIAFAFSACARSSPPSENPSPDHRPPPVETAGFGDLDFYRGDYTNAAIIGNSLPGTWRPFAADSPWNSPIADVARTHPDSNRIIGLATERAKCIRFVNRFLTPIWVVNTALAKSEDAPSVDSPPMTVHWVRLRSPNIFDTWDRNRDGLSDVPIPLAKGMYSEPARDGHICIVDPFRKLAYEMSKFYGWKQVPPSCTTFNIWDLTGSGVGNPSEGEKWWARGGKGSGFPLIAGILRPEEVIAGHIRHALTFSFGQNRRADDQRDIMMYPPACRSDGRKVGSQYPIEGMRFQLDPALTEQDLDQWGLTREGKVLARALQEYGMFLGDNGGDMSIAVQLLDPTEDTNREEWDRRLPGFYDSVRRIPVARFRVVYTGEPTLR